MSPNSLVQRDMITVSAPSQFQGSRNRVNAFGKIGVCRFASFQVRPLSVLTSTRPIFPRPDQAKPEISYKPRPGSLCGSDGNVIKDFGPTCDSYQLALPSGFKLV